MENQEKQELLATAFHEAGHCVVASLFNEKLFLKQITVNKDLMSSLKDGTEGVLLIEFHEQLELSDFVSIDNLILISLAGICTRTIHVKGKEFVQKNRDDFSSNPNQMSIEGAVDDYDIARSMSQKLSSEYQIKSVYIEWSAFKWLYDFFLDESIWQATTIIANGILKHPNKSLDQSELKELMDNNGVIDLINNTKDKHLKSRYPLTRESLIKIN